MTISRPPNGKASSASGNTTFAPLSTKKGGRRNCSELASLVAISRRRGRTRVRLKTANTLHDFRVGKAAPHRFVGQRSQNTIGQAAHFVGQWIVAVERQEGVDCLQKQCGI